MTAFLIQLLCVHLWKIALILFLFFSVWREQRTKDKRWSAMVIGIPVAFLAGCGCGTLDLIVKKIGFTYRIDAYVFRVDEFFGAPSLHFARFLYAHLWFGYIVWATHNLILIATLTVFALYVWKVGIPEAEQVLRAVIVSGLLATLFYFAFPASGPVYAFPNFPLTYPDVSSPHTLALGAIPNCLPSIHMTTALILFWYASRWRWGATLSGLYVILTVFSTLGLGEHYLLDLILAVPYALVMIWVTEIPLVSNFSLDAVPQESAILASITKA